MTRVLSRKFLLGEETLNMYGRGLLGAPRFCKECTERCNRPISCFGSSPLEKRCGELEKKSFTKSFGGGSWNVRGGSFPPLNITLMTAFVF